MQAAWRSAVCEGEAERVLRFYSERSVVICQLLYLVEVTVDNEKAVSLRVLRYVM